MSEALANEKPEWADPYAGFVSQGENDSDDWMVYAAYQWKKGNLSEAEKAYESALALDPDNVRILYQYVLLLSVTNLDKAVEKLLALAVNPEENAFIDTQAWIYFKQGKTEAAENILSAVPEEVVAANPDIAYHRGAIWYEQGDFERARKYLDMARGEIKEAAKLYKKLPKSARQ